MSVDVARSLIPIVVNKETLPDKSCKKKRTKNMQFITELTICVYRMKFETFTVHAWDDLESITITNQLQFAITSKKRITGHSAIGFFYKHEDWKPSTRITSM